jgi:hypothetical protein
MLMLHKRNRTSDPQAFDAGRNEGYRVGYYQRRSPQTLLPDQVQERFHKAESRQSYIEGWQDVYLVGSRAKEINR